MQTLEKAISRQNQIRDILLARGSVTLNELCNELNCSEATIRNDLTKLEKEGVLKRVFGGALATQSTPRNSAITKRLGNNIEEKTRIAEYVINNILKPNMVITLDSGTTNMILAQKILSSNLSLSVITNSYITASVLIKSNRIKLYLAGGEYDSDHSSFHDEIAEKMISSFYSDIVFISPNGINFNGYVTNSGISENSIKLKMIANANKKILLADSSKIDNTEIKVLGKANDFDLLVTNNIDNDCLNRLKGIGFNIVVT